MPDRDDVLRRARNVAAHRPSVVYPSRAAAENVRQVVRDLLALIERRRKPDA